MSESNPERVQKVGIVPKRRCTQEEQKLVQDVYDTVKHHIDHATNATVWFNIFMDDKFNVQMNKLYQEFDNWIKERILEYGGQGKIIHSYGFFFTPAQSVHNQEYHLDYYPEVQSMFVPLVKISSKNCTRYLTTPIKSKPTYGKYADCRFGADDLELLEREGVDCLEVAQVVCKEFTILHMLKNTVHKGIANSADYNRPMLFVTFSPKKQNKFNQKLIETDAKQIISK